MSGRSTRTLVRPRRAVHRSLHRLHDRCRLPCRQGQQRARERIRPALGRAVLRQDLHPRRSRRGDRDVAAAQRHHAGTSTPSDADFVQEATDYLIDLIDAGEGQDRRLRLLLDPRGHCDRASGLVRGHDRRAVLPAEGRDARRARLLAARGRSDRVTGSDIIAIPKSAEKPVLGHLMINDLLDNDISLQQLRLQRLPAADHQAVRPVPDRRGLHPRQPEHAVVLPGGLQGRADVLRDEPEHGGALANLWAEFKAGA